MGYCTSCGAYVPDGQTKCLACGFDENAAKTETSSAAAATAGAAAAKAPEEERSQQKYRQFDSDALRKQLDEQRKRQQENSKKWAETEYAQRQKVKEEQARNFTNTSGRPGRTANNYSDTVRNTVQNADLTKAMAAMSYVSFLFLVPMFFAKNNSFAAYHARQGMKLFLAGMVGRLVASMLGLGWLVTLAQFYLAYVGIQNVIKGQRRPLPYVGDLFK
jgi:uncharacterized membrane protein